MEKKVEQIRKAAAVLRVIAHPARLEMIQLLDAKSELSVGDVQSALGLTQSMTSQHLTALKNVGVVFDRKEGNVRYYGIKNKEVLTLLKCLNKCCE